MCARLSKDCSGWSYVAHSTTKKDGCKRVRWAKDVCRHLNCVLGSETACGGVDKNTAKLCLDVIQMSQGHKNVQEKVL